jgi:hypothetical protein
MIKAALTTVFIFAAATSTLAAPSKIDVSLKTARTFCHSEFSGFNSSETRYLINADTTKSPTTAAKEAVDVCEAAMTGALRAGLSPTRLAAKSTHPFDPNRSRLLTVGDNLLSGILLEAFAKTMKDRGYKLSDRYEDYRNSLLKGPAAKVTLAKFMKNVGPLVQK